MSNDWTSPAGNDRPSDQQGDPGLTPPSHGQYGQPGPAPQYGQPQYGQPGPAPQYGQYPSSGGYGYPGQQPPPVPHAAQPGVIPLRRLGLGDILSGSLRTIRGNPGATLGLALAVSLVLAIPTVITTLLTTEGSGISTETRDVLSVVSALFDNTASYLGGYVLSGMLVVVLAEAVLGRRLSIGGAWQRIRGRLLSLIGVALLMLVIVLLPLIVVVVATVLAAVADVVAVAVLVGVLGGISAVLWAIFMWIKLSFAATAVALEKSGPIEALRRSWELTRYRWWAIFGTQLVTLILVFVASLVFAIPAGIVSVAAVGVDPAAAGDALPLWASLVTLALTVATSTVTAPFMAGVTGLLYLNQRIIKEGLDVKLAASASAANPHA